MRILKTSVFCSAVLLLAVAYAEENKSNPVSAQATLQAAEGNAQETVNLAISGMT